MTDKQIEEYPSQNVGACPFCGENENFVNRIQLNSCAVVCDCGAMGPDCNAENDEDLRIEEEHDLSPGHVAAIRAWQAAHHAAHPTEVKRSRLYEIAQYLRGLGNDADAAHVENCAAKLFFGDQQPAQAEPIGEIDEGDDGAFVELYADNTFTLGQKVYTAPQPPKAVPDEMDVFESYPETPKRFYTRGWNDCRRAMLGHPDPSTTAVDDQEGADHE